MRPIPKTNPRGRPAFQTLVRGKRANAAVEFALVMPFMVTALLGTTDLALATITSRRLSNAAQSTADIASAIAVQQNNTNTLTIPQVTLATNAVFGIFPNWKGNKDGTTFAMTLSAVVFTPTVYGCQSGCTYTAQVAWSAGNPHGFQELRACGTLPVATNTAATAYTSLPAGVFGPNSLLIADVDYTYQPAFFGFITGDIRMRRASYVPPRIGNGITLINSAGSGANTCSGKSGS